ncbi:hypothetical protein C9374_004632 [Naegleria lovaniensis]|uniref:Uncharacterized protein n=1 Tax=Naegleria lovaniensis TaxID=51637 RepID=A0AA88GSI1_NAELO|nr:uncharacterized protein C9374_004632 [Naegleria lovaniensis]KAG2383295.1 hypothetical protein C9374_004632 [Naegleria lovaniensis]
MTVHNQPYFAQQTPFNSNLQRTNTMMMKNNNMPMVVPIKMIIKKKVLKNKASGFAKPPKPTLLLHEDSVYQGLSFETFTQNVHRLLGEEVAKMKIKVRLNEKKKFKAIRDEKKWNKIVVENLLANFNGSPIEFKIIVKLAASDNNKAVIPQQQPMQQPSYVAVNSNVMRPSWVGEAKKDVVTVCNPNLMMMKSESSSAPPSNMEEQQPVQYPSLNCKRLVTRIMIKAEVQLLKSQLKLKKQDLKNYKKEIKMKKKDLASQNVEQVGMENCATTERIYPTLVSSSDFEQKIRKHKHHHGKELSAEKLLWKQQKKLEKEKKKLDKDSQKQLKRELKLKRLEHKETMRAQIALNKQDDIDLSNGEILNIPYNVTQVFIDGNNMFFMTKTMRDLILKNKDKVMVEKLIIHIAQKFARILSDNRQPLKMLHICFDSASLQVVCVKDTFVVSSAAQHGFTTADDMLVDMAMRQNVAGSVDSCLFVTSDLALRERLRNSGAKCIGSGSWMKSCYQKLCVNTELQSLDDWMAVELKELNYTL